MHSAHHPWKWCFTSWLIQPTSCRKTCSSTWISVSPSPTDSSPLQFKRHVHASSSAFLLACRASSCIRWSHVTKKQYSHRTLDHLKDLSEHHQKIVKLSPLTWHNLSHNLCNLPNSLSFDASFLCESKKSPTNRGPCFSHLVLSSHVRNIPSRMVKTFFFPEEEMNVYKYWEAPTSNYSYYLQTFHLTSQSSCSFAPPGYGHHRDALRPFRKLDAGPQHTLSVFVGIRQMLWQNWKPIYFLTSNGHLKILIDYVFPSQKTPLFSLKIMYNHRTFQTSSAPIIWFSCCGWKGENEYNVYIYI